MKANQLASALGAQLLTPESASQKSIGAVCAGDRMSDLLGSAADDVLLVTHIANQGLVNLVELMDVAAICLVNGTHPEAVVEEAARASGTALLVSPWGMYETCGRLYQLLAGDSRDPSLP